MCWKILDRREERVLRQVELRGNEMINTEGKAVQISSGSGEDRREAAEREKSAQPRIHSTSQIGTVVGEVWGGGVRGNVHRSGGREN